MGYGSVNHNRNRCMDCGYENAAPHLEKCPKCGSTNIDKPAAHHGIPRRHHRPLESRQGSVRLNDRVTHIEGSQQQNLF